MAIGSPQWMYNSGSAYEIEQSLRFNTGDSASLSRTPASASNRRTYTLSAWVKRTGLSHSSKQVSLLEAWDDTNNFTRIVIESDDKLQILSRVSNQNTLALNTAPLLRDVSSWYHIVVAVDTTDGTANDRVKIYINGVEAPVASRTNPDQNYDGHINSTTALYIGKTIETTLDGYLAEVNFIDGQQLTPAVFGETGDYGEWKPIEYEGTYGNNGFYLPFKQDYTVEGFSTVTWKGNSTNGNYIGGVGFQPDMTWIARTSGADNRVLIDSVRGVTKRLLPNATDAEATEANILRTFETDGFTLGSDNYSNYSAANYVAWNWDMGSSNANNTTGSINSVVRANTAYGQSIVSWTGDNGGATIGHGLSSAPQMIILKERGVNDYWYTYHVSVGNTKTLNLAGTEVETSANFWGNTTPTANVFTVGGSTNTNNSTGIVAYCWHSVTGYSKFGTYNGTGSTHAVALGFAPAFIMIKCTNVAHPWVMLDNTRQAGTTLKYEIYANTNAGEGTDASGVLFTSTGFQLTTDNSYVNQNTKTFIYMAFADKREYAYWLDQSGNNNDWTGNNLTESDIMVDSPTNNFATLNSLGWQWSKKSAKMLEGNLSFGKDGTDWTAATGTQTIPQTKKIYFEVRGIDALAYVGIALANENSSAYDDGSRPDGGWTKGLFSLYIDSNTQAIAYRATTAGTALGAQTFSGSNFNNAVVGVAVDIANSNIKFFINNVQILSQSPGNVINNDKDYVPIIAGNTNLEMAVNFGQDSSFAGAVTSQGNQDANGIGDFFYAPPSGYLALCSQNLTPPAVIPSEHFNTVIYTGNGSNPRSITGVGFQPDLVWWKSRSRTDGNLLMDVLRGTGTNKWLASDQTGAEGIYSTNANMTSLDSDGFTIDATSGGNALNGNNYSAVAWNWKAGGSGTAVSESGSGNNCVNASTHSANADAGFSIVKYVGRKDELSNGQHSKVTHGMGSNSPELIIIKNRDATDDWMVIGDALNTSSDWDHRHLNLNNTDAKSGSDYSGATVPNSTHFFISNADSVNTTDENYIAYCFASVDGYSKVGSYTGNGNDDGTFVYTGFRPAYLMIKKSSGSEAWWIVDTARKEYNPHEFGLQANDSAAELTVSKPLDILSNGFKSRKATGYHNDNGATYIYLAFAETPFKYSNAR